MADRSFLTDITIGLSERIAGFRKDTEEGQTYMTEKVRPSVLQKRFDTMLPAERREMVEKMGRDASLRLLRGR
jgi:hypothetical protein